MKAPSVFISYSHDSDAHKAWVLHLAVELRERGVDATLDQWEVVPGQDVSSFMQKGILEADRVLLVCSDSYVRKAENGAGGVGFERLIVTGEMVQNIDTLKFVPLVRNNPGDVKIPRFLGPRLYIDFSDDATYETKREDLLRELLDERLLIKPPLGVNPFSGEISKSTGPVRTVGPTGIIRSGSQLLNDPWYEAERVDAENGLSQIGLAGCMELRFGLHDELAKSQLELLNAVQKSEIRTFGWPIGVTIQNRSEHKPRPYQDGIRAEVAIITDRQSYDYWTARRNGDFYLLQSFFEDMRGEKKLFFNTRIVRVTEALLFAANLYTNLGARAEANLSVRVSHRGLTGRTLASASANRDVFPRVSHESSSESEIIVTLGKISDTLVDDVRRIVEPLFMLFEFQEFSEVVYTDIIRRFEKGETS